MKFKPFDYVLLQKKNKNTEAVADQKEAHIEDQTS